MVIHDNPLQSSLLTFQSLNQCGIVDSLLMLSHGHWPINPYGDQVPELSIGRFSGDMLEHMVEIHLSSLGVLAICQGAPDAAHGRALQESRAECWTRSAAVWNCFLLVVIINPVVATTVGRCHWWSSLSLSPLELLLLLLLPLLLSLLVCLSSTLVVLRLLW